MTLASIAFLVRGVRELRNRSISISFLYFSALDLI